MIYLWRCQELCTNCTNKFFVPIDAMHTKCKMHTQKCTSTHHFWQWLTLWWWSIRFVYVHIIPHSNWELPRTLLGRGCWVIGQLGSTHSYVKQTTSRLQYIGVMVIGGWIIILSYGSSICIIGSDCSNVACGDIWWCWCFSQNWKQPFNICFIA